MGDDNYLFEVVLNRVNSFYQLPQPAAVLSAKAFIDEKGRQGGSSPSGWAYSVSSVCQVRSTWVKGTKGKARIALVFTSFE